MRALCLALIAVLLTDYMPFVTQVRYKEDYEKNKGRAYTSVSDDPETMRIKKTQQQISDVSVCDFVTTFLSSSSISSYPHKSQPNGNNIGQLSISNPVSWLEFKFPLQ